MKKITMRQLHMFLSFLLMIVIGVFALKLLNWIPSAIQGEDMRKYRSIDEMKSGAQISKLFIPSYFPEYIKWPPAEIFAQKRPFSLVIMHFIHSDHNSYAMSLFQADAGAGYEPEYKTEILYIRQETPVRVRGRTGVLVLAVCSGNERCNRLTWEEDRFRVTLIADNTPEQLIKMAESIR